MIRTAERNTTITEDLDLGIGMLIAESEDGAYEPVATISTIAEGREIAASDMRIRMDSVERGGDAMCPARYQVWARRNRGSYIVVAEIEA